MWLVTIDMYHWLFDLCFRQATGASAPGEGLKMGKWGLSDTIANDESFLSFGQLSFGVPDVGGPESQSQVCAVLAGTFVGFKDEVFMSVFLMYRPFVF